MADRIVIGNKDGSTLGVFISKPGSNVFTASSNDLLFDSTSVRYGQIYAGGTQSSISSSGLTWTSGSKATLTYIPTYIYRDGITHYFCVASVAQTKDSREVGFVLVDR